MPEEDIPITFTGLRPGEKLYEELVGTAELIEPSGTPKINRLQRTRPVDEAALGRQLIVLRRAADEGNVADLTTTLQALVPSYTAYAGAVSGSERVNQQ